MATLQKQKGRFKMALQKNLKPSAGGFNVFGFLGDLARKPTAEASPYTVPSTPTPLLPNQPSSSFSVPPTSPTSSTKLANKYIPPAGGGIQPSPQGGGLSPQGGQGGTENFTAALMKILKDAQTQQQAGQAGLLKQQQDITGTGLDLSNTINTQNIEQLNPENIIGLRRGAIGAVQPGELSVENQIRLSNAGFENVNQLIEKTLGSYEKEQERTQRQRERQEDLSFRERQFAEAQRVSNLKLGEKGGGGGQVSETANDISTLIDRLVDTGATSRISGPVDQFLGGGFGKATTAKNIYDQIKGMLSLENRQKLKGSGAISDFEARTLERAASSLGRNQSDEEFMNTLRQLQSDLLAGGISQNAGGGDDDALLSQFGL